MRTFVFLHVGADTAQPAMLVQSIHRSNPNSTIIQCTDYATPKVPGVTDIFRIANDTAGLMTMRLRAFSELRLNYPALYIDTDMLVVRPVELDKSLGGRRAMLCSRSFGLFEKFPKESCRVDQYPEYSGRPLLEVFPYVACCTVSRDNALWAELLDILMALDDRYHRWFGDQEAMKTWAQRQMTNEWGTLPEAEYGCLPEKASSISNAKILHFKGERRKPLMNRCFDAIFRPSLQAKTDKQIPGFSIAWTQAWMGDWLQKSLPQAQDLPWYFPAR